MKLNKSYSLSHTVHTYVRACEAKFLTKEKQKKK